MPGNQVLPPGIPGSWLRATRHTDQEQRSRAAPHTPEQGRLRYDPLLLVCLLAAVLVQGVQIGVILFKPGWGDAVTDWLRTGMAWFGLALFLLVSLRLTQTKQAESLTWWMLSAALLAYSIAQTLLTTFEHIVTPGHLAAPGLWDAFYVLQYPCFFLALALLPGSPQREELGMSLVKVALDTLLLVTAATALSWYFLLAPLSTHAGPLLLGFTTNLAYPLGDLGLLYGLIVVFLRQHPHSLHRPTLKLLLGAYLCLLIADSLAASEYSALPYLIGRMPDGFWMAAYLLFLLAGLVQLRAVSRQEFFRAQAAVAERRSQPARITLGRIARFLLPFALALLVSAAILVKAEIEPIRGVHLLFPVLTSLGLMLLVTIRQSITVIEHERLLFERERARAGELALRETNRQMDAFLSVASHELKTPLTTIRLHLQLIQRRLQHLLAAQSVERAAPRWLTILGEQVTAILGQWARMDRLINDLLDMSRMQVGRLELAPRPTVLATLVREAVEEQRQAAPDRTIALVSPSEHRESFMIDAWRVGQVLTNYLTNALKYSPPEQPVEVGVEIVGQQGRVWVHDGGPGIPAAQQEHIWERFYRAPSIEVQSGSGIGLGLGLYISKIIIEQHGGQVGVHSLPGAGATFWFSLPPMSKAEPEAEPEANPPTPAP